MGRRNADALIHHIMVQSHYLNNSIRPLSGLRPDSQPDSKEDGSVQMSETKIYVGLNDSETREQKYETKKYLNILKNVCRNYHVAFSVDIEEGGYFHEDGEYTEETSLVLVLVDADKDIVQNIAKDLCTFFHQESVLVTENCVNGYLVNSDIETENDS